MASAPAYSALYGFLRNRCRLDIYDAEFVYHFLTLTPEVHRALSDGVRAHLSVNGFGEELSLRNTDSVVKWSFRALIDQSRPIAGHLGWVLTTNLAAIDAWQKAWETDNGPVPRSNALEEDARERIRQSLAARWMCRSGSI
jgi:hypothetical protein